MRSVRDISDERKRLAAIRNAQRDRFDRGFARGAEVALDWVLQRISAEPSATFDAPDTAGEVETLEAVLCEMEAGLVEGGE